MLPATFTRAESEILHIPKGLITLPYGRSKYTHFNLIIWCHHECGLSYLEFSLQNTIC